MLTVPGHAEVLEGNRLVHAVEAPLYDRAHSEIFNWWQRRRRDEDLAYAFERLPPGPRRVLDIGCGTGNLALQMHARGHYVDGVDLSEPMLARLRAKHREDERLRLLCTDADTFLESIGTVYDLIAFSSVLHHLPDYVATLLRAVATLAPGGVLFVTHEPLPASECPTCSPIHEVVSRAARVADQAIQRVHGVRMPPIDYSLSDVHVEAGISPEQLAGVLERKGGVRTLRIRRYRPEHRGLAAWLNNALLGAPPTQFAFLAYREK